MYKIIDGKEIAAKMRADIKTQVEKFIIRDNPERAFAIDMVRQRQLDKYSVYFIILRQLKTVNFAATLILIRLKKNVHILPLYPAGSDL